MEALPKIPSPPSHHWREFRINFLPAIVFVCALVFVVVIWKDHVAPPNFIGEVYMVKSPVTTIHPGTLEKLFVQPNQFVKKGTPIAVMQIEPRDFIDAKLKEAEAQLALDAALRNPFVDTERLEVDYQRIELEMLANQATVEALSVQLDRNKDELQRVKKLWSEQVLPQHDYDYAKAAVDRGERQIEKLTESISKARAFLAQKRTIDRATTFLSPENFNKEIQKLKEERERFLNMAYGTNVLVAPVDGVVSNIRHHPGESLVAGDSVVEITGTQVTTIDGYIRQPLQLQPEIGMSVEVRSRARSKNRQFALSRIDFVAPHMEPIKDTLLQAITHSSIPENGLRVSITVPKGLNVVPGELVDLTLIPKK